MKYISNQLLNYTRYGQQETEIGNPFVQQSARENSSAGAAQLPEIALRIRASINHPVDLGAKDARSSQTKVAQPRQEVNTFMHAMI
ncbi:MULTISPECIES: hypothetical protein [unclassified Chelatococcus]|uniref:hypothetical protein n=1 Tax=unclassified Chelatococcus TaxID=2638111 RepID=UPI001BCD6308|nr:MULTISPECIES: hypothetical protein [unclassified Chelatococcus]MBS7739442.1 hypothetical protein [Chelatococcus sp. HY11]MBX3543811.1 hypothetical protein [Chelatococcus sp.]MCO5076022.1 hypothetical protein [Chelatococcus sp.]CAH1648480.1 hypothetical protein CHELA41_20006 [Hyphomicrobiales bacterium]